MKDRIIESVGRQMKLYGVKRFTIDDIVKDLGISKKTVYKYFSSKNELVSEYIRTSIEDNNRNTLEAVSKENTFIGKIKAALISYHKYEIPIELLEGIERFYSEDWKNIEGQRVFKINLVNSLINDAINDNVVRKDINTSVISLVLDKTTSAILDYDFLSKNNLNMQGAVDELEKILLNGILDIKHF